MTLADFIRVESWTSPGPTWAASTAYAERAPFYSTAKPFRSCLMLAVQADGANLMTVEGLANGDELHPLQTAFQQNHALAVRVLYARHVDDRLRLPAGIRPTPPNSR